MFLTRLFFSFLKKIIVIQLQLYAFSPHDMFIFFQTFSNCCSNTVVPISPHYFLLPYPQTNEQNRNRDIEIKNKLTETSGEEKGEQQGKDREGSVKKHG